MSSSAPRTAPASQPRHPAGRRFLVIALGHFTDSLSATPVTRALRRAEPNAEIVVLAFEAQARIWAHCPDVDAVISTPDRDRRGLRGLLERGGDGLRLLPRLWRRFDIVLALQTTTSASVLGLLTCSPERIGFDYGPARFFLTKRVPVRDGMLGREANLAAIRALGIHAADPRLSAFSSAADHRAVEALLDRLLDAGRGPLVGLHPGADWGCQMWGHQEWAEVGDYLHERWDARLIVTGTASERWLAERIARRMRKPPAIAGGQTSPTELVALLERLDLLVAVDSGPVAISIAVGTPVVVLEALYYAFEAPNWSRQPGDEVASELVARDDGGHRWFGDCRLRKLHTLRHCVNPACIGQGVMGQISPDAVIQAIDERLTRLGRPGQPAWGDPPAIAQAPSVQ